MTLDLLEFRTERRRPAPPSLALIAARPTPPAPSPEPGAPAAHAPSPAWAAPLFDEPAQARLAAANHRIDDPGARVARALCVLVRCALDQPGETRGLAQRFAGSAVARTIRADVTEGWALGRFAVRDLEAAVLATLGVAEIALQRALDRGPDPATAPLTRELAFGLLRALGLPDSVAGARARDAALEILTPVL